MNLATGDTYVLEEVTPARMEFVNNLILEDVERGIVRDNRDEIHRFRCVACLKYLTAVDLHVGFTQAVLHCPFCMMPAGETAHPRGPIPQGSAVHTHFEFYRPLTEAEVDEFVVTATTQAKCVVRAFGGDPSDEEDELRVKVQNSAATRLLNGLLVPRDLVNDQKWR